MKNLSPPCNTSQNDNADLFQKYIEICNKALNRNKDRFPYRHIWDTLRAGINGHPTKVYIVDDKPEATFTIQIENDHLAGQRNTACIHCSCKRQWHVLKSYMEDVVNNPDPYIENPAKLDWEWVNSRND
ncbi:MAG: hypothetical protein LRY76_03045 [Alphaproteobacteria bacterium]|nr:hypothetical protein [Alphaproteobacteria bacterium]MCD8570500.1 hypothetical protein [Alphaproteobacteria bacterium]